MKKALPLVALLLACSVSHGVLLERSISSDAIWHEAGTWNNSGELVNWNDGSDARISLGMNMLTIMQDVMVGELTVLGDQGGAFSNPIGTLTSVSGTVLTLQTPVLTLLGDAGSRKLVQFTPLLKLANPGQLSVSGVGGTSGVPTTIFAPQSVENITSYRLTAGVFDATSELNGLPLVLDGGGLVIRSGQTRLLNEIVVAADNTIFRAWGGSTFTFSGKITTADGNPFSVQYLDGGTLVMDGDLSDYNGTFKTVDANPSVVLVSPIAVGADVTFSTAPNSKNIKIRPSAQDIDFNGTFTGGKPLEQDEGEYQVNFSGSYTATEAYLLQSGVLNLTGSASAVKRIGAVSTLTGSGQIGELIIGNGATFSSNDSGPSFERMAFENGAIFAISPDREALELDSLVTSATVALVFPEGEEPVGDYPLWSLPKSVLLNIGHFSLPAGYRIDISGLDGDRWLYTLTPGGGALTRTFEASDSWRGSGEVWEDSMEAPTVWSDYASATVNAKRNVVTIEEDVIVSGLIFTDAKDAGSPSSNLTTAEGAKLRLVGPSIVMRSGGGSGQRNIPRITAAIDVLSLTDEPQVLTVSGVGGTGGYDMTYFLPVSLENASAVSYNGGSFALNQEAFTKFPIILSNNTVLTAIGSNFVGTDMDISINGTATIRGYSGMTTTLSGVLRNVVPTQTAYLKTADSGKLTLKLDMSEYNGYIQRAASTPNIEIHSDCVIPSTVILDASPVGSEIVFLAENDMTVAANLNGNGRFIKRNAGTLTLAGSANHSGTLEIEEGAVILTGSLPNRTVTVKSNTSLTIAEGASFGTTGAVESGASVVIDGTMSGTLTIASGSSVMVGGVMSGTLTVDSGATFGGSGTVSGALTVSSGTTLTPGSAITDLTLPGGAILAVSPADQPFTVNTLAFTATPEDPMIFDLEDASGSIVTYPLFRLPGNVTLDPALFTIPTYMKLVSEEDPLDPAMNLWVLRKSAGTQIILY